MSDPRFPIGRFTPPATFTPELRAHFVDEIANASDALRIALRGLDEDRLQTPYREGGWTVAQLVHHLADSHANANARFRYALTEDNFTVKPYDQDAWAKLPDACSSDIAVSVDLFEATQRRLATLLRSLAPEQWTREMQHPERGPTSIERMAALYAWHGRHHIGHINALRTLKHW